MRVSPDTDLSSVKPFYATVRSFPDGVRNCYTFGPVHSGSKYRVTAEFFYGNYDGLNRSPAFDLYLSVNLWSTVEAGAFSRKEIIIVAAADSVQVCLPNTERGTPFISELDLRPLPFPAYNLVNDSSSSIVFHTDRKNYEKQAQIRSSFCFLISFLTLSLSLSFSGKQSSFACHFFQLPIRHIRSGMVSRVVGEKHSNQSNHQSSARKSISNATGRPPDGVLGDLALREFGDERKKRRRVRERRREERVRERREERKKFSPRDGNFRREREKERRAGEEECEEEKERSLRRSFLHSAFRSHD